MASEIQNGIQNIVLFYLREQNVVNPSLNRNLVIAPPESFEFDQGITQEIIETINPIGEKVIQDTYISTRQGTLLATWKAATKENIALFTGQRLANGTKTVNVIKTIQVSRNQYAAATSGNEGFGMTADQSTSYASKLEKGISIPLTRVAYSGFTDFSTPNQWAQGADGALKFSTNLITDQAWVTFNCPYESNDTDYLSEEQFSTFGGKIIFININREMGQMDIPNLLTNLGENKTLDFKSVPVNFRIGANPDGCQTYEIKYPNRKRAC